MTMRTAKISEDDYRNKSRQLMFLKIKKEN